MQQQAANGITSKILYGAAVSSGNASKGSRTVLRVLVPIKPTQVATEYADAGERAKAVMVLDYDIQSYSVMMRYISLVVLGVMFALVAMLNFYIYRTTKSVEAIVEKQQETSLEMASAKEEAESEAKNKAKFIANVSHELRTPLNAIIGFSEMIRSESMGPIGNQKYKEFIEDIHTSGEHLLALINDILDFSKAEENKLTVDNDAVDMTKLVDTCLRMVVPRAEQSKVTLEQQLPTEHILAMGDPKRLKQALLNLLSNSVKFTPEGGKVVVKLEMDNVGQRVIMEVSDNGVGMAPQDLARAMSPFGQVDNKLSRRYEGTGLGLPLTKKLIELMHGTFDVKSEVGLGTTIRISLQLGKL
ncbi:MAG: HAMP domain-containing histidine kinase [Proteobacteria bacterium]|nr:HAMP domain-containing histidine kinase [Pseudomonadota bacterium]